MDNIEKQNETDIEIPYELEFRDIDYMVLPKFMDLLNDKDVILEFGENTSVNVSFSKKALKWIKDVKKKDPHWNEEDFIGRVIYATAKMTQNLNEEELNGDQKILEAEIIREDKDVHQSNETTNTTISN
jgi:hypothetical protein